MRTGLGFAVLHILRLIGIGTAVSITLAAPATAQDAPPTIARAWDSRVGPIAASLSMEINDLGQPARTWFEYGTDPGLQGSTVVGERRDVQAYGRRQSHATLGGLTPGTTYYYRAHVRTPVGAAASPIRSFRTSEGDTNPAPSVSLSSRTPRGGGWILSFVGDGRGLGGKLYALWSTSPDMANAQRRFEVNLQPGPVGQQFHPQFNDRDAPAGSTIYVQGVIETPGGTARTEVVSVVIRSSDY